MLIFLWKYILNNKYIYYIMNDETLRLELSTLLFNLRKATNYINGYSENFLIDDYDLLNTDDIIVINNFYNYINILHIFCNKYNYDDLIKIDFDCKTINEMEINFINNKHATYSCFNVDNYKKELYFFKSRCIKGINNEIKQLKQNNNIKLIENDILFSLIFYYIIDSEITIDERENFGYVIKLLLDEKEHKLVRNILTCLYDTRSDYNGFIRKRWQYVETFDEQKYEYKTKYVVNPFYNDDLNNKPTELFEKKYNLYNSKYNEIQKFININNIQLVELD
jgi:hypothetical protein